MADAGRLADEDDELSAIKWSLSSFTLGDIWATSTTPLSAEESLLPEKSLSIWQTVSVTALETSDVWSLSQRVTFGFDGLF